MNYLCISRSKSRLMRVFLFIFFLLSTHKLSAQALLNKNKSDNSKLELSLFDSYSLSEEKFLVPNISFVEFDTREKLIVYGRGGTGIIAYSKRGTAQTKIGNIGRGPFEYTDVGAMNLIGETIFVWDSDQLKLVKYSTKGKKILELNRFKWAVKDFSVIGNDIYFYNSGNIRDLNYIERYDIGNNKYKEKYGERSQEDIFLGMEQESGGLVSENEFVYYIGPGELSITRLNRKSQEEEIFKIEDKEFKVPEIKDARAIVGKGVNEINKTLMRSSYVRNLFLLENYVIIMGQIGEAKYNSKYKVYTAEEKKIRFYILDKTSMSLLDTFTFSNASNRKIQDFLWTATKRELVLISPYDFESDSSLPPGDSAYKVHFFQIIKK